jgi:hypothetical protein
VLDLPGHLQVLLHHGQRLLNERFQLRILDSTFLFLEILHVLRVIVDLRPDNARSNSGRQGGSGGASIEAEVGGKQG